MHIDTGDCQDIEFRQERVNDNEREGAVPQRAQPLDGTNKQNSLDIPLALNYLLYK